MLLQALRDYSRRRDLPPALYTERPVRYWIDLDPGGELLASAPTDTADPGSPAQRRGLRRRVPYVQRTVATRPQLLADDAEYTLGLATDADDPRRVERAARRHRAYLELVAECHRRTESPWVGAVRRFLDSSPLDRLELGGDYDASAVVSFRVAGCPEQAVVDLPPVQAFWAEHNRPPDSADAELQCLVCSEVGPAERRLKEKIRGIPGGQSSGTALISANSEAFLSYGLEESLIAPVCGACSEAFTKGLNSLLSGGDAVRLGDTVFTSWTREERRTFNIFGLATRPEDFSALLDVGAGREPVLEEQELYAVALSAAGGRAAVRDWVTSTVGEALDHARLWYRRQRIVGRRGEEPWADAPRLGLRALAAATARDLREVPPTVPRTLLRGFLTGGPLPMDLLIRAVHRVQAERAVQRNHAGLIKLVLRSHEDEGEEDMLVSLNEDERSAAYHCGRLLAELENAQRTALGDVNATIVDRYFRRASTAPEIVFGPLVQGVQPHLAKLERDNRPAYWAIQRRLEEILTRLPDGFPAALAPRGQGEFVLGYYHQRASNRADAAAAREGSGGRGGRQ